MAGLLRPVQTSAQQHSESPVQRKAPASRGPALLAPEAPDTSHRPRAAPKGTVLTEEGGGTTSGTVWSGSACLGAGWPRPVSSSGCSPSWSAGGPPCGPRAVSQKHPQPAPEGPGSRAAGDTHEPTSHPRATRKRSRLEGLPQAHGFLLPLDSSCACSSTPVTSSLTSSVAPLPEVTFCIVLLSPSPSIVPRQSRLGSLCPPASWGRGETEPQRQQLGAWGPPQPRLYGFQPCRCPYEQHKTGSKR